MRPFPADPAFAERFAPYLRQQRGERSMVREGVRLLAQELDVPERVAMTELLARDIWPERFSRCRGAFSAQALSALLSTRVLLAGCGGRGGHAAALLARMGVGSLVLCDPDRFEESNLNRQLFCTEQALGRFKAEVCRDRILSIASYMDVEARTVALNEDNLPQMLKGVDVVMDCLDSIARKKMLEEAANRAGVPCVQGSVARNEGLALFDGSGDMPFSLAYPGEDAGNREGAPMNTHVLTVAGTACLMVSLFMRRLCRNRNDDGKLFHLDLSIPELETLTILPRL